MKAGSIPDVVCVRQETEPAGAVVVFAMLRLPYVRYLFCCSGVNTSMIRDKKGWPSSFSTQHIGNAPRSSAIWMDASYELSASHL